MTCLLSTLLAILIIINTAACSDGGGVVDTGGDGVTPTTDSGDQPGALGANRGLTGTIATVYSNQLWKLDLFTGKFTKYNRLPWDEDPVFHNLAIVNVAPIRTPEGGFVLGVHSCEHAIAEGLGCVLFLDRDAKTVSSLYFNYDLSISQGTISVSRDGKRLAFLDGGDIADYYIDIYDIDSLDLLSDHHVFTFNVGVKLDWGTDGYLYYSRQDTSTAKIFAIDPETGKLHRTLTIPHEGYIGEVAISPSGREIAFELINSESSVYIGDLETLSLRRLVKADDTYPNQFFSNPEWSPDGKWILVEHNATSLGENVITGLPPYNLIAVPSDARDMVYHVGDTSPDAMPFAITDNATEVLGVSSQASWWRSNSLYWVSQ